MNLTSLDSINIEYLEHQELANRDDQDGIWVKDPTNVYGQVEVQEFTDINKPVFFKGVDVGTVSRMEMLMGSDTRILGVVIVFNGQLIDELKSVAKKVQINCRRIPHPMHGRF